MTDSRCLVPLPWETRNLGVEAFAVEPSFLDHPDEALLRDALADVRHRHVRLFVQARCRPDSRLSRLLESNGFYFVEATLSPAASLTECPALDRFAADPSVVLPRRYDRVALDVSVADTTDAVTAEALRSISAESFVDDRFHADHNCPAGAAGRRYRLWVGDLLGDASVVFHVLRLRSHPVAFMASRHGDLLLAGFARRYANAGLGEFFWLSVLERLRAAGIARVTTRISLNNVSVLNLYSRLDFKLRDPQAMFHLWSPG